MVGVSAVTEEKFQHQIRLSARELQEAELAVHRADAELKKTLAQMKLRAAAEGVKTVADRETYADQSDEVFTARITLGQAEARRAAMRVELKAREADFDQWKAQLYMANREARRYGA